jgi:hypothetical protein
MNKMVYFVETLLVPRAGRELTTLMIQELRKSCPWGVCETKDRRQSDCYLASSEFH